MNNLYTNLYTSLYARTRRTFLYACTRRAFLYVSKRMALLVVLVFLTGGAIKCAAPAQAQHTRTLDQIKAQASRTIDRAREAVVAISKGDYVKNVLTIWSAFSDVANSKQTDSQEAGQIEQESALFNALRLIKQKVGAKGPERYTSKSLGKACDHLEALCIALVELKNVRLQQGIDLKGQVGVSITFPTEEMKKAMKALNVEGKIAALIGNLTLVSINKPGGKGETISVEMPDEQAQAPVCDYAALHRRHYLLSSSKREAKAVFEAIWPLIAAIRTYMAFIYDPGVDYVNKAKVLKLAIEADTPIARQNASVEGNAHNPVLRAAAVLAADTPEARAEKEAAQKDIKKIEDELDQAIRKRRRERYDALSPDQKAALQAQVRAAKEKVLQLQGKDSGKLKGLVQRPGGKPLSAGEEKEEFDAAMVYHMSEDKEAQLEEAAMRKTAADEIAKINAASEAALEKRIRQQQQGAAR